MNKFKQKRSFRFRPIKSGFSSSLNGRLSRPAYFDSNHPYATVSERSVNLINGSSRTLPTRNIPLNYMNDKRFTMNRGSCISNQSYGQGITQQHLATTAAGTMSYFPSEITKTSNYGTINNNIRNHRNRNSQNYSTNSNTAAVNSERMCLSDMESNDLSSLAGASATNLRYKQQQRQQFDDFKSLKQSTVKSVKAGAIAVIGINAITSNNDDAVTSVSLPNVVDDDVQIVCDEFDLPCDCPPKSASGDNFLELQQTPRDYDNISEGSYKLSDNDLRSAHSDIQTTSLNPVYATKFTAKRVGNVIVKKVLTNTRSTPNTTDDEDPCCSSSSGGGKRYDNSNATRTMEERKNNQRDHSPGQECLNYSSNKIENNDANSQQGFYTDRKQHSSSAPASYAEYPFHQKLIPVEIDGPNVNLDEHRKLSDIKEINTTNTKVHYGTTSKTPVDTSSNMQTVGLHRCTTVTNKLQPSVSLFNNDNETLQWMEPKIVYTSKGTILHRPKIIPDEDDSGRSENIYSNVSITHTTDGDQSYPTIPQPQQAPKTYGAIRPLPGKIITKENMVITPDGYRERKPKPIVPPKPKILASVSAAETDGTESTSVLSLSGGKFNHPIVNVQNEGILQSSAALSNARELNRPTLISVQSEDNPEIQKCHLFNSDIPYVLTMRNISTNAEGSFSTFKDTSSKSNVSDVLIKGAAMKNDRHRSQSGSHSPDGIRRRKSLDLVPKKRLPSPGNFSSQDHSLSSSTPESGDVLEYLLRRRNVEKSAIAKRGRRGDPRRQTQPVRFNIPQSTMNEVQQIGAVSQPNLNDNDAEMMYILENDERFSNQPMKNENDDQIDFKILTEQSRNHQNEKMKNSTNIGAITISRNESIDSTNCDDFPPPPPPPPPPPSILSQQPPIILKQSMNSAISQPITEACLRGSVEALPYVDESNSSRASYTSKDDVIAEKIPPPPSLSSSAPTAAAVAASVPVVASITTVSTSTQRTITGVLWTDF